MRKTIYILASLIMVGCTEVEGNETVSEQEETMTESTNSDVSETPKNKRDDIQSTPEASTMNKTYRAEWFQIEYPANFVPAPTTPTDKFGDYEFIETDEATFTSPDGTVEFFIYSPQWSGNPKDYLVQKKNEKITEEKKDVATSGDPLAATHRWVTFEDKNGAYTRAYHSIQSETTHHVFGVKYTNRKLYEKYKADYTAFKKSLKQFAD